MQVEIKGFIHAQLRSWEPDKPEFHFYSSEDMSCLNSLHATYVLVQPVTIKVDIPAEKFDYRMARVAALEKEETKLRADFAKRCAEIKDEISKLQAITFEPVSDVDGRPGHIPF